MINALKEICTLNGTSGDEEHVREFIKDRKSVV